MQAPEPTEPPAEGVPDLDALADRLRPAANRAAVLARFDELFRGGSPPDPRPDGFLPGRLLATSTWRPLDAFGRAVSGQWMPWQGKSFDRASSVGINVFTPSAILPMRIVFPGYAPDRIGAGRIDAFPFRNRLGPGELDRGVDVLKIDYDFEPNPRFIIRRILDELVQIAPGVYLGKILFRTRGRHHPIGFFSLRSPEAPG